MKPDLKKDQAKVVAEIQERTKASPDSDLNRPVSKNCGTPAKCEVLEIFGTDPAIYERQLRRAVELAVKGMIESRARRFRIILRDDPGCFPNSDLFGDSALLCVIWD